MYALHSMNWFRTFQKGDSICTYVHFHAWNNVGHEFLELLVLKPSQSPLSHDYNQATHMSLTLLWKKKDNSKPVITLLLCYHHNCDIIIMFGVEDPQLGSLSIRLL
jgi:hypothetical protein